MKNRFRTAAVIAALTASAGLAQTNVGGPIVADTTWDLAGSPYIVQTSIIIGANATLTIDAGVEVRVEEGLSIAVGSQAFGPGALIVNGTTDNRVLFTGSQGSSWNDLFFTGFAFGTTWDQDGNYQSGSRLQYCTILDAGAGSDSSTGALSIEDTSLELLGVTIHASARDGIEADFDDNLTKTLVLNDCAFTDCQSEGIDILRGTGHIITDTAVTGNGGDGVNAIDSPNISAENCAFENNGSEGFYANDAHGLTMGNCTFKNNSADGLEVGDSDGTIVDNCLFDSNSSVGLYWYRCDQSVIQNSEFQYNSSYGTSLQQCNDLQYLGNLVLENGNTGTYMTSNPGILISGSRFEANGGSSGGGLYAASVHGTLESCEFVDNQTSGNGGGARFDSCNLGISGCEFAGNTAGDDGSGSGGGIYYDGGSSLPLEQSIFRNNFAASWGGAVYLNSTFRTISECAFEYNEAVSRGGAIYITTTGNTVLAGDSDAGTYNSFWGNTADSGADLYNGRAFDPDGDGDIDASFVCWGTEDFGEIGERIHDFFDDANLGIVGIFPVVACEVCPADFNGDGEVNTLDVLAFLTAFSAGDSSADFNHDGEVNTLDVLAFLSEWTAGC